MSKIIDRISAKHLVKRWGIDYVGLKEVVKHGLQMYAEGSTGDLLEQGLGDLKNLAAYYTSEGCFESVIFLKTDIERFEKEYPELRQKELTAKDTRILEPSKKSEITEKGEQESKKPRHSKPVMQACQERAKKLWSEHPDQIRSSKEMAMRSEIQAIAKKKSGESYSTKKIQEWVSKVAPDYAKKPGIRPKH